MSRTYKLTVEAVGISEEELGKVMKDQFGWEGDTDSFIETTYFNGDGSLGGGLSEQGAHHQINEALIAINPKARINTRWTYMDDLPFESYGDTID